MSKSNFNITLSFCFKPEPSNTFHSLIPLPIVKNVVFRRAQIQRSCSIADWAQRIELSKIKRMIIRNISIHRICDIIRRARCLLTDIFDILNIFFIFDCSFLLLYRRGQYKRNQLNLCVGIRACSCVFTRLIQLVVVS